MDGNGDIGLRKWREGGREKGCRQLSCSNSAVIRLASRAMMRSIVLSLRIWGDGSADIMVSEIWVLIGEDEKGEFEGRVWAVN